MPEKYTRIHRLLRILTLIQSQSGWNAAKLAEECGTSERNVYRDLKALEGAGIPYYFCDETHGYRVRRNFFLPPVDLTLEEALALLALANAVGESEQVPMLLPAVRAIEKVRGRMPGAILKELDGLDGAIHLKLAAAQPGEAIADVYELVRAAIQNKRALSCRYESQSTARGRESTDTNNHFFLFKPYRLFFDQRAWYAIGYHEGRQDIRCLKLNRFSACQPTDRPYAIPDDFDLEARLGHAWRMIRGEPRYDVVLRFDPLFADTIAETHWHKTQEIDWCEDGSIIFRCSVDGLDEILWWVLGMGPHCRVEAPRELAKQVKDAAARMMQLYED